jgi:hypothetical protein
MSRLPTFGKLDQEVIGSHTNQEWIDLLTMWNWRCFYCAEPVQNKAQDPSHEATKDHMTPISRGGVDFIGNIVPACLRCNQLKGEKTVEEFRAERAWVLSEKSTGDIRCAAQPSDAQLISPVAESPNVEIVSPAPPLTTIEVAAMWKRVVADVATRKGMQDSRTDDWWQQRRAVLKKQAQGMKRTKLEAAGQMILPIFGDNTAKRLAQGESAILPFKGMDVLREA